MRDRLVAFTPLLSSVVAALVVLYGNYRLQHRVGRRLRDAEELKRRLYELVDLASRYWTAASRGAEERELEARILASKLIILLEFEVIRNHSRKLRGWHLETEGSRLDLMDAVTGGCFQQQDWSPDPQRVALAAREVARILASLSRAC